MFGTSVLWFVRNLTQNKYTVNVESPPTTLRIAGLGGNEVIGSRISAGQLRLALKADAVRRRSQSRYVQLQLTCSCGCKGFHGQLLGTMYTNGLRCRDAPDMPHLSELRSQPCRS